MLNINSAAMATPVVTPLLVLVDDARGRCAAVASGASATGLVRMHGTGVSIAPRAAVAAVRTTAPAYPVSVDAQLKGAFVDGTSGPRSWRPPV